MTDAEKLAALIADAELLKQALDDEGLSRPFKGMAAAGMGEKVVAALPALRAALAALSQPVAQ